MKTKTIEIISLIILIICIGVFIFWVFAFFSLVFDPQDQNEELYLVFRTKENNYRVKIPDEVVKSQDCKKYYEWSRNSGDMAAYLSNCPWRPKPKGRVGEFVMNGIKLNVPRKYIHGDKNEPDGIVDILYLMMLYPGMTAPDVYGPDKQQIDVNLESRNWFCNHNRFAKQEDCDPIQVNYEIKTELVDIKECNPYYELVRRNSISGLDEYTWHYTWRGGHRSSAGFYITGDPMHPDYWIKCGKNNNIDIDKELMCESYLDYKNKITVHYRFYKSHLQEHKKVREAIIQKLKEFTIEENCNG